MVNCCQKYTPCTVAGREKRPLGCHVVIAVGPVWRNSRYVLLDLRPAITRQLALSAATSHTLVVPR